MYDDVYEMYLEELEAITPYDEEEGQKLALLAVSGDLKAKERLIEGGLFHALSCAREYEGRGILMGDLVQEANIALIMAVSDYREGDWKEFADAAMRRSIEATLEEQGLAARAEEEILARVNVLKEVSQIMAEELGREATVEELADRMKMTEEEIKEIMKLTLDALSLGGE